MVSFRRMELERPAKQVLPNNELWRRFFFLDSDSLTHRSHFAGECSSLGVGRVRRAWFGVFGGRWWTRCFLNIFELDTSGLSTMFTHGARSIGGFATG